METRGRPRSQGKHSVLALEVFIFSIVWLCGHPRVHRQWLHDAHEVSLALYSSFQVVPCLRLRYLYRRNHVDNKYLVKPDLQQLRPEQSFRLHSNRFQCWKVALCRLYHLLLPSGPWFAYSIPLAYPSQLAYEARKAKKIIASRDISYAFTNVMANNYYSLRACGTALSFHSSDISARFLWSLLLLWSYQ